MSIRTCGNHDIVKSRDLKDGEGSGDTRLTRSGRDGRSKGGEVGTEILGWIHRSEVVSVSHMACFYTAQQSTSGSRRLQQEPTGPLSENRTTRPIFSVYI